MNLAGLRIQVPGGRGWRVLPATLVAAVVAPAVTTTLLSVANAAESLLWIFQNRNASPELKSLLGYDFDRAISAWPLEALRDLMFAPLFGIAFGFVGAFLFLAVGFYAASRRNLTVRGYMIAGAIIGLIHSAVGLSLRGIKLLPWSAQMAAEPFVQWIGLIGGFLLTGGRPTYAALTFLAASLAGALAGYVYARMLTGSIRLSAPA